MLKPLGDRVVVRIEKEEEQTVGGLVLAGGSKELTKTATVVAVGEGIRTLNGDLVALAVSAGQTVLLEKSAGIAVKHDGEDLLIVRESEVLAIIG
jgi:chaperonin GroES